MSKFVKIFAIAITVLAASAAQAAVTVGQQAGYCAATYHVLEDNLRQSDPQKAKFAKEQFNRVYTKYVAAHATAQDFSRSYADTSNYYSTNRYKVSLQQIKVNANNCLKSGY